jgi:hypothetical protein
MDTQTRKLAIISAQEDGATKMLQYSLLETLRCQIDLVPLPSFDRINSAEQHYDALFFVSHNWPLSVSESRFVRNSIPTPILQSIWNAIDRQCAPSIHIAIPLSTLEEDDARRLTALDILALATSGVTGIWEISSRLLDDPANLSHNICLPKPPNGRDQRVHLFGRPAARLFQFYQNITNPWWPAIAKIEGRSLDDIGPLYRKYGFLVALGLALLQSDELTIETNSKFVTQSQFAELVSSLSDRTGCVLAGEVIDKVLGALSRGWAETAPGFDKRQRHKFPIWARGEDFPSHMPLIRDCEPMEVGERLYAAVESLRFDTRWEEASWNAERPAGANIYLPHNLMATRRVR